jgi:hypothetical protein
VTTQKLVPTPPGGKPKARAPVTLVGASSGRSPGQLFKLLERYDRSTVQLRRLA